MQSRSQKIWFTPDIEVDNQLIFNELSIKGRKPLLNYPFTLKDIYPIIPSTNAKTVYNLIKDELIKVNTLLHEKLKLRDKLFLPSASSDQDARTILSILFDPVSYYTDGIEKQLAFYQASYQDKYKNIFRLTNIYPFSLKLASPQKLAHTLGWIDTNIKVKLETIGNTLRMRPQIIQQLAEMALKAYSYLVKMDDFTLAHSMNFNFSMFLQDKILNIMLGDALYLDSEQAETRGKLSNQIALQLFKEMGELSYEQICAMSTFMGVVWTSTVEIQKEFESNPESALTIIESQLKSKQNDWCINHIDKFISDIGSNEHGTVVVILDDNGESAIDMALFQRLLIDFPFLKLKFIVNLFPVSNNISLNIFQALLYDEYFLPMKQYFTEGRVKLLLEEQGFRSFEIDYLKLETQLSIENANLTYIKGVNFFETLQIPSTIRYHCFTVYGPTSILLTGCGEGKGVFAKLQSGQTAFTYFSFNQVETLKEKILKTETNHDK